MCCNGLCRVGWHKESGSGPLLTQLGKWGSNLCLGFQSFWSIKFCFMWSATLCHCLMFSGLKMSRINPCVWNWLLWATDFVSQRKKRSESIIVFSWKKIIFFLHLFCFSSWHSKISFPLESMCVFVCVCICVWVSVCVGVSVCLSAFVWVSECVCVWVCSLQTTIW